MKSLFSPAINLMNRLSFSKKFVLLGGLFLIALIIVSIFLSIHLFATISTSQQQLMGLTQIQNLSKLIASVQQHRGISSALISGVENKTDRMQLIYHQTTELINEVNNSLELKLKKSDEWSMIVQKWKALHSNINPIELKKYDHEDNFNYHTELITQLLSLQRNIADYYRLPVVNNINSYYLNNSILFPLPISLEILGQIRGLSGHYLTSPTQEEKEKIRLFSLWRGIQNLPKII